MNGSTNAVIVTAPATVCGKLVLFVINTSDLGGTVRNSVRWAMMMKRRESSHGYRERTSGPAPGW
ncbi:hypothetical protein, partial [Sinorhizobium meliloti]|uniref:hypothetical protein n=1 Tax=Rhizobium meliloti TaxID=382 RepID=UPI000FE074A7